MTTINDVAKKAKVSTATVSRVLNNSDKVRPATRDRVSTIIKELNFVPNVNALGLQRKKTKTVGLIFPDASAYYFSEIMQGINRHLFKNDHQILISSAHDEEEEIKTINGFVNSGRIDGLIIMMPSARDYKGLIDQLKNEIPVVFIACEIDAPYSTTILLDNYNSAKEMVHHLSQLGRTRIAFIHGGEHNYDARERHRGYIDARSEYQLDESEELEVMGNFTEASGFQATLALMKRSPAPTAIFAANDAMAIGAIEAARVLKLSVPADLAIVGFDDISLAAYLDPALTTVHVPLRRLGHLAGESLLKNMNMDPTERTTEKIIIPLKPVIRRSCGSEQESA
ncbi:MAG: LacI family DNA-binding transcriptional regulator [FCB group bacterium]|nr:LacI family DNA-binding transcriptional regulator [FCB group bacterium]MBL7029223.1 LacI family DNA-binding transcriptional regulator [Candidatus Neomarinimicrobiota bacterium]MBL7121137.1 LacI family DNA-binding transcriptional regulator [Candidatus Neomarinimicrobiota bacterium]